MLAISAAFRAAIPKGYQIANAATILSGGNPVQGAGVSLTDATVTVSRTAAARRSASFTIALTDPWQQLIPSASNTGPLTPFGNEIAPSFGWINPATRLPELVQVGVYAIETVTVNDTGSGLTLAVTGYDRAWTMSLRKFTAPYAVTAGTRGDAALSALVTFVLGSGVPQNITPALDGGGNPLNLPGLAFNENTDPWSAVQTIVTSIGYEAFFDAQGVFVARPLPDPMTAQPVWSMVEGPGNIAKSYSRSLTRNGVSNDFIVTGSGSGVGTPVRGQAQDTSPASPMYVSGPFGDVPTFTNSSLVTTVAQAQAAAANQLAAARGQLETLTVVTYPCPVFEPDDVIYCQRSRAGVDGYYVVDTVQFSLRHDGSTTLTARRVR